MDWHTIRKIGRVKVLEHGSRVKVPQKASQFLLKTLEKFARLNGEVYYELESEATRDYPPDLLFSYSERTIKPALVAARLNARAIPFAELGITRRHQKRGFVDLWVLYHKAVYLLECKHAWRPFTHKRWPKWARKRWEDVVDQARNPPPQAVRDFGWRNYPVFRVATMFVPVCRTGDRKEDVKPVGVEEVERAYTEHFIGLRPKPDWVAVWVLNRNLQKPLPWNQERTKWGNWPALFVFAKIERVRL